MVATAVTQEILQALNIYPAYLLEHRSAEVRAPVSQYGTSEISSHQCTVLQSLLSITIQTVVSACLKYFNALICLVPQCDGVRVLVTPTKASHTSNHNVSSVHLVFFDYW